MSHWTGGRSERERQDKWNEKNFQTGKWMSIWVRISFEDGKASLPSLHKVFRYFHDGSGWPLEVSKVNGKLEQQGRVSDEDIRRNIVRTTQDSRVEKFRKSSIDYSSKISLSSVLWPVICSIRKKRRSFLVNMFRDCGRHRLRIDLKSLQYGFDCHSKAIKRNVCLNITR